MEHAQSIELTTVQESSVPSPFAVSWQKLMLWIFIVTDALLFAGFLAGYGFVRLASPQWPNQSEVFHLSLIAVMTFVLISSSATMASAVAAARDGHRTATIRFLTNAGSFRRSNKVCLGYITATC